MKRLLALVLAAAMCLTLVSFASAEDDKTPITFRFYNADGKNADWDNPVAAAITAATGVTLKVEYPVSSQGDAKEDVARWIALDEYPDLCYTKGDATNLYEAGALIDMTDLIEQYGPNIKKMYGEEFKKLQWGNGDTGIYQLSYAGVGAQSLTSGGSCQIQYAALKENDWKVPKTIEEYEALIKQYLAAHPKTDDGLDMIGITISSADWHWMITLGNPAGFIFSQALSHGASPHNAQRIISALLIPGSVWIIPDSLLPFPDRFFRSSCSFPVFRLVFLLHSDFIMKLPCGSIYISFFSLSFPG